MDVGWSTADYALIVSLCSAAISLLSLGWNVWSKFIFPKARIEVCVYYTLAVGRDGEWPDAVGLTAINHGPHEVSLRGAVGQVKRSSFLRKNRQALLKFYEDWPLVLRETEFGQTPKLPLKLPVGDQFSVYLPVSILENKDLKTLGFVDGFGREHFAIPRKFSKLKRSKPVKK